MKAGTEKQDGSKVLEKLKFLMEKEFLYRNSNLDLPLLSNKLDVSKEKASRLINHHFGKSFTTYLNDYRLKEVLRLLQIGDSKSLTITGIATKAGFTSKSTFYRHFKYRMNSSPSTFLKTK